MPLNRFIIFKSRMISYDQVSKYVRNKKTYHEAMGRAGYHMPNSNSPLCSLDFMDKVRRGEMYCPKTKDLAKDKICFSLPPK